MAAIIGAAPWFRALTAGSRLAEPVAVFDMFRIPRPAQCAVRLVGLLCGVALTCAASAFGMTVVNDLLFAGYRCPARPKLAALRVGGVHAALTQYQIERGRCPTGRGDLIDGKYLNARDLVDPWGTSIAYWCHADEMQIRSAGPDKLFNTDDDIAREL
jgi:hypothetical protein